jgi:hypothetical protein
MKHSIPGYTLGIRLAACAISTAMSSVVAWAQAPANPPGPDAESVLHAVASGVDARELDRTIAQLVGFGTRHTLSDTVSTTRGIGAARRWAQERFAQIAQGCGGCIEIATPEKNFSGKRIPQGVQIVDVLGIQRGSADPERVVMITGHLDSRVSDVMVAKSDAPGADDDGSGVSAVLEAARVLSQHRFRATIVYGVLSGEEQGLYGGQLLADYAKERHWQVEADLNNDIIGNSRGSDGVRDNGMVRVFSEGTKAVETPAQATKRRYNGGELDSPSRNLARALVDLAERELVNFRVEMVYRTDRFGRGGDQVPLLEAGFPAVRLTEGHEDYTREHQDVRVADGVHYGDTADGIDSAYLAQVTRLNVLALAQWAGAPAPPKGVEIQGAVTQDTTVRWAADPGATAYRVWWRGTTEPRWRLHRDAPVGADAVQKSVLENRQIDDWFFGVSALSAEGFESPVVFPGDAGAF